MGLFKSKEEKDLDAIIQRIEMNMQNNYKDNAQSAFAEFSKVFIAIKESGKMKGKALLKYEKLLEEYTDRLQGYSHKDQKPYWT